MKQLFSILLLSMLVLLIGYGGAGVNMVSYCCEHCAELGTEALVSEDCCCTIHLDSFHTEHKPVSGLSDHEGHCELTRVQFDWNTFFNDTFSLQPMVCPLTEFIISLFNIDFSLPLGADLFPMQNSPPMQPRVYLSFLTLLLI